MAATQAHCSVDERLGQIALAELPREKDGLAKKFSFPHSAKAQALREIFLAGQMPRPKNYKPLLKIQQNVMSYSDTLECKKLKRG
jgi:hypothetical protein